MRLLLGDPLLLTALLPLAAGKLLPAATALAQVLASAAAQTQQAAPRAALGLRAAALRLPAAAALGRRQARALEGGRWRAASLAPRPQAALQRRRSAAARQCVRRQVRPTATRRGRRQRAVAHPVRQGRSPCACRAQGGLGQGPEHPNRASLPLLGGVPPAVAGDRDARRPALPRNARSQSPHESGSRSLSEGTPHAGLCCGTQAGGECCWLARAGKVAAPQRTRAPQPMRDAAPGRRAGR